MELDEEMISDLLGAVKKIGKGGEEVIERVTEAATRRLTNEGQNFFIRMNFNKIPPNEHNVFDINGRSQQTMQQLVERDAIAGYHMLMLETFRRERFRALKEAMQDENEAAKELVKAEPGSAMKLICDEELAEKKRRVEEVKEYCEDDVAAAKIFQERKGMWEGEMTKLKDYNEKLKAKVEQRVKVMVELEKEADKIWSEKEKKGTN